MIYDPNDVDFPKPRQKFDTVLDHPAFRTPSVEVILFFRDIFKFLAKGSSILLSQ